MRQRQARKTTLVFRATCPTDVGQVGNLRATQRVPRLTAASPCQRGSWPIANRPQLAKLPHQAANHRACVRVILRVGDLCMKFGAMVLAVCGVVHGFQAAPAKGSIEGQVMNAKAGSPLKKASVQLVTMNPGGN